MSKTTICRSRTKNRTKARRMRLAVLFIRSRFFEFFALGGGEVLNQIDFVDGIVVDSEVDSEVEETAVSVWLNGANGADEQSLGEERRRATRDNRVPDVDHGVFGDVGDLRPRGRHTVPEQLTTVVLPLNLDREARRCVDDGQDKREMLTDSGDETNDTEWIDYGHILLHAIGGTAVDGEHIAAPMCGRADDLGGVVNQAGLLRLKRNIGPDGIGDGDKLCAERGHLLLKGDVLSREGLVGIG